MTRYGWGRASVVWLIGVVVSTIAGAGELTWDADPPLVPPAVREAMQDKDFGAAVKAIDAARQAKSAPADYLGWLKGRALTLADRCDDAVAVFEQVEKEFPKSPWVRQARFGKAIALARKGDFRAAQAIYRGEAEYLLSSGRKQQIADIYLEFAHLLFHPAKEEQQPDYAKAREFFVKALEVGPQPEKRIEVELLVAQCHQRLKQWDDATRLYRAFLAEHPEHARAVEARFRLGETRLAAGDPGDARRVWEDLSRINGQSRSPLLADAAYNLSRTWGVPEPQGAEALSRGVAALESFIERFPQHRLAAAAHLDVARSYVFAGRYDKAVAALEQLLRNPRYQERAEIADARSLLGHALQLQQRYPEALKAWNEYLSKHPTHHQWSSVQQQIVDTEYLMGEEKYKAEDDEAARKLWNEFLVRHPLDGRGAEILFLFGQMDYRRERWEPAIEQWRRLVSKFPESEPAARARLQIAQTLEQKLGKPEEALEEYHKIQSGPTAAAARQAERRLTRQELSLSTGRVFRSDETPRLRVALRNIEKLTLRAYAVDLPTYFRKMHRTRGIENLDVALINTDATVEYTVPQYAKYQPLERLIELPLPEKRTTGAMVVTVSSQTLEATTLVLQSDLDIIVKSSRDEVFVFAENMRTGKPWPGVKLLLSDGQRVFAEGQTRADGTFQQACKELATAGDVRVLAVAETHVASNVVELRGVEVARGLSDKGYLYTDRPVYRAGQIVHLRGCIRHVPAGESAAAGGDQYAVQAGKQFTLEVFDSRNRPVRQDKVTLGPLGTFHTHFPLPAGAAQGDYRILVHDEQAQRYQGQFAVQAYVIEPIQLSVDTPRKVYYRGESIEGTIRAAYDYGAPLAGQEIRYQLGDQRQYTATTDVEGKIRIKLPTQDFAETQAVPLTVILPQRNLQTAVNFFVATQGFSLGLSTVRPVYLAGESFEVTVTTRDAEAKPTAQKLTLKVLQRITVAGRAGEKPVAEYPLETAAADGTARKSIVLPQGGRYIVRAEATDRFQNPIAADYPVVISDDDDPTRLRLLADRHTYTTGQTARVQLHWREEPALALVTYQGARVLGYRLVSLQRGENPLEIPLTARLAPNFELAVAVMNDPRPADEKPRRRLHTASSPITVQRDLRVNVEWKAAEKAAATPPVARPGEPVEITVTTTDPQGKPVAAEVSLALVERGLLQRFGENVPAIEAFFRGEPRQPAVRTTSSITFDYRPPTRPISRYLLAERDRVEVDKEERASRADVDFDSNISLLLPLRERSASESRDESGPRIVVQEEVEALDVQVLGGARADTAAVAGELSVREKRSLRRGLDELAKARDGSGPAPVASPRPAAPKPNDAARFSFFGRTSGTATSLHATQLASDTLGDKPRGVNAPAEAPAQSFAYFAPTTENVQLFLEGRRGGVLVLESNGVMSNRKLSSAGPPEAAAAVARELARSGAVLVGGPLAEETGYWNPAVVTGDDGKATLKVLLPERSTAWTLVSKGITGDTLAGQTQTELVARKALFGELKLPLAFTDGDKAEVLATVHNELVDQGAIEVALTTTVGGTTTTQKQSLEVKQRGPQETAFTCELHRPAGAPADATEIVFELRVSRGEQRDVVRRNVPLLPYGVPVYATASGAANSDTTAWVELPPGMPAVAPSLEIVIGPTVQQSLIDIVLAPTAPCQRRIMLPSSELESATSDVLATLALQKLLRSSREGGGPHVQALDQRLRSAVSLLVAAQNDDGGWSWTARGKQSDRRVSARGVWALATAKTAGYRVADDTWNKARQYLRTQLAAVDNNDYESQAAILHALQTAGEGDFALANRLHRDRPALPPAALAYTALTLAEMDRKPMAQEILTLLESRDLDAPAPRRSTPRGTPATSSSPVEVRALWALALEKLTPQAPRLKATIDGLLAARSGQRWSPDKATGPATVALCQWYAATQFDNQRYQLAVFVNDTRAALLDVAPAEGSRSLSVPAELLKPGRQRINFQLTGRGQYTYQCILSGFVPADKVTIGKNDPWEVHRTYEPAPLEVDGRAVKRGFEILQGSYTSFRNPLAQLPLGRRGDVELRTYRRDYSGGDAALEYLVITEPLPAGTSVIESSIQGGFERFEITPGAIVFYVGSRSHAETIRYQLAGYLPGAYRIGPTQVRDAYRPERMSLVKPATLAVLPAGATSGDPYRLTPVELFELGKLAAAKGDQPEVIKRLAELIEQSPQWQLRPEPYKEAIRLLLAAHLQEGPPSKIVRYFEIVKEKWPAEEIDFAKILRVGAAYHEMGEYERSYLVYRATVESSFVRESGVAGFLDQQQEFLRSVDVLGRLLREYPAEPYAAAAAYALAQQVYSRAPQAAADPKLRQAKVNRIDLIRRAWRQLESFLTAHPADPAADQAAFAAASALLEMKAFAEAATASGRYATRYPHSELLDSFWYVIGYCQFAQGHYKEALEMCRKVAETRTTDRHSGAQTESRNKWRAIYILGQIHHSLGEAAEAIAEYRRVEEKFADAKEAILYFLRKAIELPEVTTIRPGQPAELELKFRNLAACDVKVYRIDLMKFSLLQRNLAGITAINLAGIQPYHEATVALGDGRDYRDRVHKLALPLKDEGAYLIVCRGDDLHASGLVLVTPLAIEVQEDATSGRVRTTVKDAAKSRYLPDVHVKVIGGRNSDFVAGPTDLRGVFVSDGIRGTATVIAQADGSRYAFYRGQTELGPTPPLAAVPLQMPAEPNAQAAAAAAPAKKADAPIEKQLLEGVMEFNRKNQAQQVEQLNNMYRRQQKGVEAQKAF